MHFTTIYIIEDNNAAINDPIKVTLPSDITAGKISL